MKRFLILLSLLFCSTSFAATETINWYVDGNSYATTTCQTGGDIILPNTPYKYGYTFQGWNYYTQIEYLKSTGAQYINTGFKPNVDTKIIVKYGATNSTWGIFGARPSSMTPTFAALYQRAGGFRFDYGSTYELFPNIPKTTLTLVASTNLITLHDTQQEVIAQKEISSTYFDIQYNIYFPGFNTNNSLSNTGEVSIYYFQIYDNNTLVRDFIPVIDSQNIPCMYDKVTNQFFYNQGTGNFIAGPVINQ